MERKCKSCGHWNQSQEHCENCGVVISPEILRNQEATVEAQKWLDRKKSRMELVLNKMRNSKFLLVRAAYHILKVFWVVYMAIITFILWFVALGPG